ncbi:MAG TPA: phosphatase PAP2 family protein [Acidimicrobiales bacterium]|nr:phosphatase PAP2 family protein [Acidimicrobiales bacterium]
MAASSARSAAVRLAAASSVVALTAVSARRDHVGPAEERVFRMVNELPDSLSRPVWLVMQLGTVGAAPVAAAATWARGDRRLAGRLLVVGTSTWALSKVFKRWIARGRPAALLAATHVRGSRPAGLGYLSGHAGVVAALGAAILPRLQRRGRALVGLVVPAVGLARVYVGAHLPLDVVGGAALGLGVEAASRIWQEGPSRPLQRLYSEY